ncbi:MAG: cytochrome P450 [Candidatus Rokubacteria bacterium]|nr:cytochrome P450 [Candidatus Rokubacteria bacterium]
MPPRSATPPGPKGLPLVGSLLDFGREPLGFLTACARDHGDMVAFDLAGWRTFLLNHPDLAGYVLLGNHRNFVKHRFFWRHVEAIFGQGLLTSEGDFWLRQRRLMAPAFHGQRLTAYGRTMVEFAERRVADWRDGEVRNVHTEMMALTMEIVAECLFGAEMAADAARIGRAFDTITEVIQLRYRRPIRLPDWLPVPSNLRYRRGIRELEALVYRIIAERREGAEEREDLLSLLLAARDEDGSRMSDAQLRDEAITLFLAGHETTALVLSWTWYLLSRHPEVEGRLGAELDEVLAGRPPAVEDLPRLRYTEQVVTEAMRLFPPAWIIGRQAVEACEIGGYPVPAGSTIYFSPWVIHRDPRWFEEPESFRPERWGDGLAERLPRYAYMPFGGGPRVCIGNRFAMMEAVLLLAAIARRWRLRRLDEDPVRPFPTITLRPQGGVPVRLERRGTRL